MPLYKAPEGWRAPGRFAHSDAIGPRVSVLEYGGKRSATSWIEWRENFHYSLVTESPGPVQVLKIF